MSDIPIKILLVEDNPADARLLHETLKDITKNKFELTHIQSLSEAIVQLAEHSFDAILLDLFLPDSHGLETVERILSAAPALPIIVLTGLKDESAGIQAVRKGAQDYLIKGQTNSDLLIRAINYSTERKRVEEELRKARDELEIRVKERTIKLEKAVDELHNEILRRIEAENKILANQEQLRVLTSELLITEERERHKIAIDLHDSVGQILAFLKIELGNLQHSEIPGNLAEVLGNIRKQVEQAIKQTRTLTFDISPPELYTLGFESAIEELAQRFTEKGNFQCLFETTDEPKPLSEQIKIFLYRSVRELLINATKHSRAKVVRIDLRRVNNDIQITVQDDGVGFSISDLEEASRDKTVGFGLLSIRERLMHIGGKIDIQSGNGIGTTIKLLAPLKRKQHKERSPKL
jgi:signal transduction histidine kinase